MHPSPSRRRFLSVLLGGMAAGLCPRPLWARPDMTRTMDTRLLDQDLPGYRFVSHTLDSDDGRRHYRLWLGIPRSSAPARGHPALYLLDGNAVISRLQPRWLSSLEAGTPPLLVSVGYDSPLMFHGEQRAYDYTPAPPGMAVIHDIQRGGREGGGAATFLTLIEQRIMPWVADQANLDVDAQGLWGHSFGGLFTLFALATRASLFRRYFPVSPSLSWADGLVPQLLQAAPPDAGTRDIWLSRGTDELGPRASEGSTAQQDTLRRQASQGWIDFASGLSRHPGWQVHWHLFQGLQHGQTFSAALPDALRCSAGLPTQLAWQTAD